MRPYDIEMKENQEEHKLPNFRCLSFDLECYSEHVTKFPNASLATDCIFQIGVMTQDENNEQKKYIFTLMQNNVHLS